MTEFDMKSGAIIPAAAAPLRNLTVTMTVMCYLASLAIGALILINHAVEGWTKGLSREVTGLLLQRICHILDHRQPSVRHHRHPRLVQLARPQNTQRNNFEIPHQAASSLRTADERPRCLQGQQ